MALDATSWGKHLREYGMSFVSIYPQTTGNLNASQHEGHENKPNRVPPVRRDTSRFSLQDLTSLVVATTPQPPPHAPQRYSIVPAGMAISPQTPSTLHDTGLCEVGLCYL